MENKKSVIGFFLILLGIIIGLGNLFTANGTIVLPVISIILLFVYFYFGGSKRRGNIGFLIPGVIIGVVGIYSILLTNALIPGGEEPIIIIMLGAAFLIILFVHTIWLDSIHWGEKYWPVFPASVLILVGAVILMITADNTLASYVVPAFLILFGLFMLINPILKSKKKKIDL